MINSKQKILFISPVNYSAMWQRHQSFADCLCRSGFCVIFINPVISSGFSVEVSQKVENLYIADIKIPFKGVNCFILQSLAAKLALLLLKRRLKLKIEKTILWLSEPSLAELSKEKWQKIIYDRCDYHGYFPGQNRECWQKYEDIIFKNADIISVSHLFLKETLPLDAQDKAVLALNACSEKFRKCHINGIKLVKKVNALIRVLSSGAHYEWIDMKWLEMLAENKQIELNIAGSGRGQGFKRLLQNKSVIYHGKIEHDILLRLMRECDIGVIPFVDSELIRGVDPIKVYEYAATGLEIWAPPIFALNNNLFAIRFIESKESLNTAIKAFRDMPLLFDGILPVWEDRLQSILDRLNLLQAN